MHRLIRLYPAAWRRRYGTELEQLVDDLRPTTSRAKLTVDLAKGALSAHVREAFVGWEVLRRPMKRGLLVAGILWLGLSIEIVLSNVVFPGKGDDNPVSVILSYLIIFAALVATGALAARHRAGLRGCALVAALTGAVIALLTLGTFAVVDNVWLDIVRQQQPKIAGFAHSDAGSMREYINTGLLHAAVALPLMFAVIGAVLGTAGGVANHLWAKPHRPV